MNNTKTGPKVMASYRISPDLKLELAATAKELGMTMSQYQEALIVGRHKKFNEALKALHNPPPPAPPVNPNNFKIDNSLLEHFESILEKLQRQYPKYSKSRLLIAALKYVLYNEREFITKSFHYFLK